MSEGDVSGIRDEDLLRRMWQQTEDFGRKKEIRAHMYRLREERLRSLYSPEPASDTKGCEFTSAQKHVSSFADQTFQSMKSKEVRDAGSPPKEFTYRGQDLKELSNAGWNVESEDRRTDDGRTRVKSVNANIEGRYDVEGGRGQFAAVDRQRQAVTEYRDDGTQLRRDETSSDTAAHEHVVRHTGDGTRVSSTTSSSNTSSQVHQVSSSVHEVEPRPIHNYDQRDTNRNKNVSKTTNTCDYEQNLRTDESQRGELVSRKIDYPDGNTKVVVETRCLPDGTRVTSTRREFHAPAQSTRSEYQTRSESKYNSQLKSDTRESSKVIRHSGSTRTDDIVDSQRHVDDYDFKRQLREYVVDDDTSVETQSTSQRHESKIDKKVTDHAQTTNNYAQTSNEIIDERVIDKSRNIKDAHHQTNQYFTDSVDQTDRREVIETYGNCNVSQKDIKVTHRVKDSEERVHSRPKTTNEPEYVTTNIPRDVGEPSRNVPKTGGEPGHNFPIGSSVEPSQIFPRDTNEPHFQNVTDERFHIVNKDRKMVDKKLEEVIERKSSSEHYQTTYQTDYQQKKVSNDWSPSHQAWASTLRADTPSTTRPSTRASSPGSKTFKSSTSSLRSSVSPDKGFRKPYSRGASPSKVDRCSPTRSVTSDRYSSTSYTHSTIESRTNKNTSPERKPPTGQSPTRSGQSPDRRPQDHLRQRPSASPEKQPHNLVSRPNASPERSSPHKTITGKYGPRQSPDRYYTKNTESKPDNDSSFRPSVSPHRKPINDDTKPSFSRRSMSPDIKRPDEKEVGYRQPTSTREPASSPKRPSVSPDRKPDYMRPTVASQPNPDTRKPSMPVGEPTSLVKSKDHKKIQNSVTEDHQKITEDVKTFSVTNSVAYNKATSPTRKSPEKDAPHGNGLPMTKARSQSPQKKKVCENDELYESNTTTKINSTKKYDKQTEDSIKRTPNETSNEKDIPSRGDSPSKFGTYDKKKPRDVRVTDVSPRDENSPSTKVSAPKSPTKKSPRDSISPLKTQDAKYKQTSDFISTEKMTEEVIKKTVTKERPRQLVTPSTSPTRQSKIETEPSTGQSSPTTSVSGFVYFGSPRTEKVIVTDLDDDFEAGTDLPAQPQSYMRPETLDVQRSQSPSKIPCRSPSPEKCVSSTTDNLPRKSSLKKPSNYIDPVSPMDKPPSTFQISPTEDKPVEPEHKVVKKDNPGQPKVNTPMKTKPPLNRRETYEERCRLILGMLDTDTTETITKEIKQSKKKTESDKSSPCDSPILRASSPFVNSPSQEKINTIKTDVTDFIVNEKEDLNKTAQTRDTNSNCEPALKSPSKLHDMTDNLTITQVDTTEKSSKEEISKTAESKYVSQRLKSPEKIKSHSSESPERQTRPKSQAEKPTPIVPRAESPDELVHGKSKLPRPSISPARKTTVPVKENPDKNVQPKTEYKISSYDETNTTENTRFDTTNFLEENIQITKEKTPRTRVLESPNREISKSPERLPSSESPSRPRDAETSPTRRNQSPNSQPYRDSSRMKNLVHEHPETSSQSQVRQSPEKVPGYMKTTAAISSKYDSTSSTTNVEQINTSKTIENKHKTSVSPTRKNSQDHPRSVYPTNTSQPNNRQNNEESPDRKLSKDTPINSSKPTESSSNIPGYLKKTASTLSKHEISTSVTENISEHTTKKIVERKNSSGSPTRKVSQEPRTPSPTKFTRQPSVTSSPKKLDVSPERKPAYKQPISPAKEKDSKTSKDTRTSERSPSRVTADKTVSSKNRTVDYQTVENVQETIKTKTTQKQHAYSRTSESPTRETPKRKNPEEKLTNFSDITKQSDDAFMHDQIKITEFVQTSHISKPDTNPSRTISPERKPSNILPTNGTPPKLNQNLTDKSNPMRSSVSPDRKPSYMKPTASVISKLETTSTTLNKETTKTVEHIKHDSPLRKSPPRQSSIKPIKPINNSEYLPESEGLRQLRTPSPTKTMKITEVSTDFLMSEREQEILDRVHKSLRKLSPERKEKSPSREKSPNKNTTSLQDLDITTTESIGTQQLETDLRDIVDVDIVDEAGETHLEKPKDDKLKEQKVPTKPTSRNVSPIKKNSGTTIPAKVDKTPESPTKSRSISPRKHLYQADRPQSPQTPRASGIRPRDQVPLIRKPTPATLSTYKIEKLTTDVKKTNGIAKQNVTTKTTTTSKTTSRVVSPHTTKPSETETKRIPTPKSIKDNVSPRKEPVIRTASESNVKSKKTSPQRMKSKPEIQVNDISPKSSKYHKTVMKEPYSKLPAKPKSATALNTSTDEDDIIVDVQQSKSSRENSPDRICPTPVNFADDVGTPRFPDEVSEPDDEYRRRSYHTIQEAESVVDDIVEICEDEELFAKKTNTSSEYDDSLLSVNEKVNKFTTKISSQSSPKDTTTTFKDTERKVHSDFANDIMKSDECLLSVSEKVNKFAKGPSDTNDSRSPSRKITDEYDKTTNYQDDYTKLSVNDKAHLFVETAENIKLPKLKTVSKVDRPDLSNVEESLKKDNCLLSVSDKVNKFVKSAENYLTETHKVEQKEKKIKEQHEKIIRQIVDEDEYDVDDETYEIDETTTQTFEKHVDNNDNTPKPFTAETKTQPKVKDFSRPSVKPTDRTPIVKITTLRSSEAVKKAKALFENIASTQKAKDVTQTTKTTKLTDIGVVKKSPKTDSTIVLHPSVEDMSPNVTDGENEVDVTPQTPQAAHLHSSTSLTRAHHLHVTDKSRSSPNRLTTQSPEVPRAKSPLKQKVEIKSSKNVVSRYPGAPRSESPSHGSETQARPEHKPEKVPGYLRPTKTSQIKEETKIVEEAEVSTRRGSGKFGVELKRTSIERSTVSSERRRSVEHHQPCIEDIFDLDLLEQMLEKVVGYEQRRRIRSQIRVVKKDTEHEETHAYTKTKHATTASKPKLPEQLTAKSPEHLPKSRTPQRTLSPQRQSKTLQYSHPKEPAAAVMNGHPKESKTSSTHLRPQSPEKPGPKSNRLAKSPARQPSPDKKRTVSPNKTTKLKENRFNEYASAYMKKVGLNEANKIKLAEKKTKKATESKQTVSHETQDRTVQEFTTTKSLTERTSSKDVIEIVQLNGKRSPSPEKPAEKIICILRKPQSPERIVKSPVTNVQSPERRVQSPVSKVYISERRAPSPERKVYSPVSKGSDPRARSPESKALSPERKSETYDRRVKSPDRKATPVERLYQRTPSPDFKRQKSDTKKETIIKTVYNIEKKTPTKPVQEEKPSWVTNRNLKKMTSETRTFSSKKLETEKPKYRATSPSKVITKPIDVITSSYGPGPLDADGKPLFGIKALRNGASNFQVKGTVIRQEFHSRNGSEPEGTVSVTAYSSQPEELERLLASQGAEPPSRVHGLAAITTTKKFGGDTGVSMSSVNTKEERASLEQFTHTDRKMESQFETIETCSFEPVEEIAISDSRRVESRKSDRTENTKRIEERVTEVRKEKEERREKVERREDKKTVRQSSVKSLTEKFIKSANDSGKSDRSSYPKAGLILRTTSTLRDSVSSDEAHPGLMRSDSEHSVGSAEEVVRSSERGTTASTTSRVTRLTPGHQRTVTSTVTHHQPTITTKRTTTVITGSQEPVITKVVTQGPVTTRVVTSQRQGATVERSFLDSHTKVTGVQDILTRMKNADIVIEDGDSVEDSEARALLNKFLGATVLMAGMQGYVSDQPGGRTTIKQETVRSGGGGGTQETRSPRPEDVDLDQCWDERLLRKLLDECIDYEQRRRLRARIRTLMAEQEACASAVTDALGAANISCEADGAGGGGEAREEEEVTVTSSVRRDSSEKTVSSSSTKSSKVTESVSRSAPKPASPFAKFRQLEKQNSTNSPNSPKSPQSPGSPSQPYFKFTDPALQCSALTIKERLLQWCRDKTRDYENVKLENFSTSWADGLAFCALVHHFLPETFDYSKLTPERRRHNFTLAFKVADEKAGIYPLLDVDDMVAMRKPDWKCVFTYVQSVYRRFKDQD